MTLTGLDAEDADDLADDRLWMFPGGRKQAGESEKQCLLRDIKRDIKEELPKLKLGRLKLWKEVKKKNRRTAANLRALATAFRSQADILKRK